MFEACRAGPWDQVTSVSPCATAAEVDSGKTRRSWAVDITLHVLNRYLCEEEAERLEDGETVWLTCCTLSLEVPNILYESHGVVINTPWN